MALIGPTNSVTNSAIWIIDRKPMVAALYGNPIIDSHPMPENAFPFSRLASITSTDGSATYLYHQMNGTTLAEEQYDASLNIWLPTVYITVSNS